MKPTESINMALTVHRVNDPEQNLLTDQHWDVIDTILSHSNFQELPMHFFGNGKDNLGMLFKDYRLRLKREVLYTPNY